jgi:bis(5'-nucleosidyl)-tetraphosphatase
MAEIKKERSYGAVIVNRQGEILIEHMKLGHYSIPKGHVEKGETPEQTAKREIREETSLEVKLDTGFAADETYAPYPGIEKKVTFFLAYPLTEKLVPQEIEVSELKWMKPEEGISLLTYESDKDIVRRALAYIKEKK